MPKHTSILPGESRSEFISKCTVGGSPEANCILIWEQARMALQLTGADFAATPFADLPIVDEDFNPRGQTDAELVDEILGPDGDRWDLMKQAHLLFAPGDDRGDPPETREAYKLPVARMVDDRLTANRQKVSDAIGAINGARAPLDAMDEAKRTAFDNAIRYLDKAGVEEDALPSLMLSLSRMSGPIGFAADLEKFIPRESDSHIFEKDIIRTGHYRHPVDGWEMDITSADLDNMVTQFDRMKANGVDVEVVVDHSDSARDIVGYIDEMRREGDTLIGVHRFTKPEGIEMANAVKNVSIMLEPFEDSQGNDYGVCITHSALVQKPVVPGQKEFVPMSFSLKGGGKADVLYFNKTTTKEIPMLNELKELFKLEGDDFDEAKALDLVQAAVKERDELKAKAEEHNSAIKAKDVEIETLAASLNGKDEKDKIDPELELMLVKDAERELNECVAMGNCTPKFRDEIKRMYIGEAGARKVRMFSSRYNGNKERSMLGELIDAIKLNDPVVLGEQTKAQRFSVPAPTGDNKKARDEDIKRRSLNIKRRMPNARRSKQTA